MVALTPLCGTGVRKYGKNFQAIAEVIGNKLEAHIRSFFINFRRRYNLDEVLAEYEAEHGTQVIPDDDEEVPATAPAAATADNNNTEAKEKESKVKQTCQVFTFHLTAGGDHKWPGNLNKKTSDVSVCRPGVLVLSGVIPELELLGGSGVGGLAFVDLVATKEHHVIHVWYFVPVSSSCCVVLRSRTLGSCVFVPL